MKIVHLALLHRKDDIRIFYKECRSLREKYEITYVTSDFYGEREDIISDGIKIRFYHYVPEAFGITRRFIWHHKVKKSFVSSIVQVVKDENPDVVHIHEYTLLFVLRPLLKEIPDVRIVYDVHEDSPRELGVWYRTHYGNLVARMMEIWIEGKEKWAASKSVAVITATDFIKKRFESKDRIVEAVKNWPILGDITVGGDSIESREACYCYSGGITEDRGITTIVRLAKQIDGIGYVAGKLDEQYEEYLKKTYPGTIGKTVLFRGYLGREEINELYHDSVLGLCILSYNPNYYNALPIKMFEYMAAGIPVICSNFPLWKEIVESEECGITVNPKEDQTIISALNELLNNRKKAEIMGKNGRKAVEEKYNWDYSEKILMDVYARIEKCVE